MLDFKDESLPTPRYEDDFIVWLEAQAEFLRTGQLELLDRENLIDELTSMANRDRREMGSRLSYPHALRQAVSETGLPASHFPPHCPYSVEQLLDDDFLP